MASISILTSKSVYFDGSIRYKDYSPYVVADTWANKVSADNLVSQGLIAITAPFTVTQNSDSYDGVTIENAYDPIDDMLKVKSMQKQFRDNFTTIGLDRNKFNITQLGSNMTVSQPGDGTLTIASGTDINSETIIDSVPFFTVPCKVMFGIKASQKIVNQEVYMELVSCNSAGVIDGQNAAAWVMESVIATSATRGIYQVQSGGLPRLNTATYVTVLDWTTAGYVSKEIELYPDECWFHDRAMDSSNGRSNSYVRHIQIPDPNAYYKVRIRVKNLGTAPASNTTVYFSYIVVTDFAELTAEITAGRGNSVAGQGIFAQVSGSVTATGVAGAAAHDAVISGSPVRIAGRALTANYTTVATGDTADLVTTLVGALIQKPYAIPELDWVSTLVAPITTTTDTSLKVAPAAGLKNYITALQIKNTNAVATEFMIKEAAQAGVAWTRASTTISTTLANNNLAVGDVIQVTVSSDTSAIPLGFYAVTAAGSPFTFTALNAGGASGTLTYQRIIWRSHVNASMNQCELFEFPTPLRTAMTAQAVYSTCVTTGANVYVNAQGYQAP